MTYKSSNIDYRNAVMNNVKSFVESSQEVQHGLSHSNSVCLLKTRLDMVTKNMSSNIDYRSALMNDVKPFVECKK